MENRYRKEFDILPGMCDSSAALGIPDTFGLFMDIASEHARALGCGIGDLGAKGLFWLTVRTRARFFRRPALGERCALTTWPEEPGRLRANRDYVLEAGGETLAMGKTEWAVLDRRTGRLTPPAQVYAPDMVFRTDSVWEEPFSPLRDEPLEEYARYTVRSTDIDMGDHMNNVAYVRALAGTFSGAEWQALGLRELEIAYRTACHEGDPLIWQKRAGEDGTLLIRAAMEDGKAAVLARIIRTKL